MRMSSLFTELRLWAPRRWTIAAGVAMAAYVALALVSGAVVAVSGSLVAPGPWWAYALPGAGAAVMGLVVASYFDAPIGAADAV
ncbi:hypothetical protein [Leifsonia sp. A12D58]|uniref:hypothetical protein n=1 Tax=Leifsonia sp. A12D58 TaxID=3397674 RepID=UPI0039E0AD78